MTSNACAPVTVMPFLRPMSALYQVMAAQVVERSQKAPQCTSILPASTSMAPMIALMGIFGR